MEQALTVVSVVIGGLRVPKWNGVHFDDDMPGSQINILCDGLYMSIHCVGRISISKVGSDLYDRK